MYRHLVGDGQKNTAKSIEETSAATQYNYETPKSCKELERHSKKRFTKD
jgi:hypothetical protein